VSLVIWDHSVTCHQTQVYTPRLNSSQGTVIDLPYPEGIKRHNAVI